MNTATINGTTLAYETSGNGEPVLLLHCGFVAAGFAPLFREPSLTASYQLINYHRRGYGASAPVQPPFEIAAQAADCLALMDHLGTTQAHLVGHSFGANIALEVARIAPERVHTLALIEPPLPWAMQPESLQIMMRVMGAAVDKFIAGDLASATNEWLTGAFGPGWQAVVEANIPGGVAQAIKDSPAAIGVEAPSLQTWSFGPDNLKAIRQPTLAAYHVDPRFDIFDQVQQTLVALLPQVESLVVPNVTHLMQIQNARSVADGLAAFFTRHTMAEIADAR